MILTGVIFMVMDILITGGMETGGMETGGMETGDIITGDIITGGIETGGTETSDGIKILFGILIKIIIPGTWGFIVRIITNPVIMGMQTLSETTTTDIEIATTEIAIMKEEL